MYYFHIYICIYFVVFLMLLFMSDFDKYPYRYLFKYIPNYSGKLVTLCYYGTCYGWSSAFYCNSRHELCKCAHYSIWQLSHALPSGSRQLSLNI